MIGGRCTHSNVLSRAILIVRFLFNRKKRVINSIDTYIIKTNGVYHPGDFCEEATPVPIPNTAVKLFSADDTQ